MTDIRSIAVLAYEQVSEQDSITPLEIFKGAAMVTSGQIAPWERESAPSELDVKLVGIKPGVVTMQMGTQVVTDAAISDEDLYDVLYVPGGVGSGAVAGDERVLSMIRRHHEEGRVVAANCSGVGVLARAGILGETPVTCVAAVARGLRAKGINVPEARRMWIGRPEERIWTFTGSYGVNGGAVAMVAHYLGREIGTIVSMMFDTIGGIGAVIFVEETFQKLLPADAASRADAGDGLTRRFVRRALVTTPRPRTTTPPQMRDISWIRGALQTAIAIEHATMPLYSAAMYSLEVQNYPSYNTIRSVLMEEMLHMAAACNMLAALGGSPRIRELDHGLPRQGLPGRVAPELFVALAPLSARSIEMFMRIEAPFFLLGGQQRVGPYDTIGRFYEAISDAVRRNAREVRDAVARGGRSHQVGGNLGYRSITAGSGIDPVEQCLEALEMISDQGEGKAASTITAGAEFQNEGSHYARFAELKYGRTYREPQDPIALTPATEAQYFQGEAVPWPVVINTLAVPQDGYAAILALDPAAPEVRKELDAFDASYTAMMIALDGAWNGPIERSWASLGEAVVHMNEMRVVSCFNIMRLPVPEAAVARIREIYPREHRLLAGFTDLTRPVFYGPRFANLAAHNPRR